MAKLLSELLQAQEPMFTLAIKRLEASAGQPGLDARLAAEIITKAQLKTRQLGLDPVDTTGEELYLALLSMVGRHDEFLVRRLGGSDPTDVADLLPRMQKALSGLDFPKRVWALKPSVAKRLLRAMPPKNVMKQLGYRSVDSMVKRESVFELFGALRFAEPGKWLNSFLARYESLSPGDFETRDVAIVVMDAKKWGGLAGEFVKRQRHNLTHLKELGAVFLLPLPAVSLRGIAIATLPLLLRYLNEVRLYSAFFKLQQVKPDFGKILVETLVADPGAHAVMAGQAIHWRVIQRYFGSQERDHHPEIFEPHVQPEDLRWRRAEAVLFRLEPALHFWHDMDYVAVIKDGRPVSFSLTDVAISYVNQLPYGQQTIDYFREALWDEIFVRYMAAKPLENQVLQQLAGEAVSR